MARSYGCMAMFIVLTVVLSRPPSTSCQYGPLAILRSFVITNVAGPKVVHEKQTIEFDPDVADRRRFEFEARNGVNGKDLVERLGLGEDGFMEQRRLQQRGRDQEAGYFFNK